jgi:hypothetical protein
LSQNRISVTAKAREVLVAGGILDRSGSIKYIQTAGATDPGNSGGAAVDTNGEVRGVLVADANNSNMLFLIPREYVGDMLAGRLQEVIPGPAVRSDSDVRQSLSVTVGDPARRLRQVAADIWAARPGKVRAGGDRTPARQDGDGPIVTVAFDYSPDRTWPNGEPPSARGDLNLPPLADGQVYWFRPHYESNDGRRRWGEAVPLEMGRFPVELKVALLAARYRPSAGPDDRRRVELHSYQSAGYEVPFAGNSYQDLRVDFSLDERTFAVEKNGDAKIHIACKDLKLADSDVSALVRKQLRGVTESIKDLRGVATLSADGHWKSVLFDFAQVPISARAFVRQVTGPPFQTLTTLSLPLPGKNVLPGDTWKFEMRSAMNIQNTPREVQVQMTAKYFGRRSRAGREEAVIGLTGKTAPGGVGPGNCQRRCPCRYRNGASDTGLLPGESGHSRLARVRSPRVKGHGHDSDRRVSRPAATPRRHAR